MRLIPVVKIDGVNCPSEPLPNNEALKIVCDGENYIVYEAGDELPEEVNNGE